VVCNSNCCCWCDSENQRNQWCHHALFVSTLRYFPWFFYLTLRPLV
jgi:hypothetical protein